MDRAVEHRTVRGAAAVVVPCASRKALRSTSEARAVSLARSLQDAVETAWLDRVRKLDPACPAASLYCGRGSRLAREAAAASGGALYYASAGLGLVSAERALPAYGLTVTGKGPESVALRVAGPFDPAAWWSAVNSGPFATPLADLFAPPDGTPVLVGLTQPYARMVAPALEALPEAARRRLRIFGANLCTVLPAAVVKQALPYDERLEAILPGTRADFPQRALLHFARGGLHACPSLDLDRQRRWVEAALAGRCAPGRPHRLRLSDADMVRQIERHLPGSPTMGLLLRALRDREGIACEQSRFARLYRAATGGTSP